MKITPDSSLFTALSNSPLQTGGRKPSFEAEAQIRQDAASSGAASSGAMSKEDLIRRALADGNLRQQAVKMAQSKRVAANAAAGSGANAADLAAQRGSVTREVPFSASSARDSDSKPVFKRLGQLLDLRV